jgi:hypothetical protein
MATDRRCAPVNLLAGRVLTGAGEGSLSDCEVWNTLVVFADEGTTSTTPHSGRKDAPEVSAFRLWRRLPPVARFAPHGGGCCPQPAKGGTTDALFLLPQSR